jgi:hypothetical protein
LPNSVGVGPGCVSREIGRPPLPPYICGLTHRPMSSKLHFQNTITHRKEVFEPLSPPHVGMYVCGPTVYGDAHLGHARSAITFDVVFRYLRHLGYKVRYVRNITDVGHLENDADHGEDKIAKKARLEQLEPMEVVQYYKDRYHRDMDALNVLRPSIEPQASGHIIEQIAMTEQLIANGFAYVADGSVYFDVEKFSKSHHYGKLSGRKDGRTAQHNPRPRRSGRQAQSLGFCPVETSIARTHHALAFAMGRGFSGLAHRVLGDEPQVPGRDLRHSRGRPRPALSAPRMRNCPERWCHRARACALLAAQQHDHPQRAEDGQVVGQHHHAARVFQWEKSCCWKRPTTR